MNLPILDEADLVTLRDTFPDLDFGDAERRRVLLAGGSFDVNAVPGSGKTSILAAKLYLLARKWFDARRGICVISHTNVARREIERRLAATTAGARLLSYPHFIGTIHAFVNQFLALPMLRSLGITVDVIDDDAFARRALSEARRDYGLRLYLDNNSSAAEAVETLQYEYIDGELVLTSSAGKLPGPGARSYPKIVGIKDRLTAKGVFRFDDMFAFAKMLLTPRPGVREAMSCRFPLVLIDEMQDTSLAQESLLDAVFDESVTIQRYGDINQRILSDGEGLEELTFPKKGFLNISSSKRFAGEIASAVASVQMVGEPVNGLPEWRMAPTLLLYTTERAPDVIQRFGEMVFDRFDDCQLQAGEIRATCTRKRGESKEAAGRHLGDYWPGFLSQSALGSPKVDSAWSLLSDKDKGGSAFILHERALNVRRVVLLALRQGKSPHVQDVRDASQLFRSLTKAGIDTAALRLACRDLAFSRDLNVDPERWSLVSRTLYEPLRPLLGTELSEKAFASLDVFSIPDDGEGKPVVGKADECIVEREGRRVRIGIGTVASMKGETHLATLVLESHGGQSRKFDLAEAFPMMCGAKPVAPSKSKLLNGQFRNLYVAMSRPSHYLCVAMNGQRASEEGVSSLVKKGWEVVVLK